MGKYDEVDMTEEEWQALEQELMEYEMMEEGALMLREDHIEHELERLLACQNS